MSVIQMTNGMLGKYEVPPTSLVPSTGFPGENQPNIKDKPMRLQKYVLPQNILHDPIDVSTRRQVLPCKGLGHQILRREAVPSSMGMRPPTGIARHEDKGIAYEPQHPLNGKILPRANFFDVTQNNPLGIPR